MSEDMNTNPTEGQKTGISSVPLEVGEEAFNRYKEYADNAKIQYETLYRQMVEELSVEQLEPLANTLLKEKKSILKDQEQLVEKIRKILLQELLNSLDSFWTSNNVNVGLITLEICKDKFKDYADKDWQVNTKTPNERLRPIRMRLRDSSIRFLQAQLKRQRDEIDQAHQECAKQRNRIQNIEQNRVYLLKIMEEYKKKFEAAKSEILRLQFKVLDINNTSKEKKKKAEEIE